MPEKVAPEKIAKIVKVHKIGGSFMIALPPEFIAAHGIKEDDTVGILANHMLYLHPMKEWEPELKAVDKAVV